MKSKYLLFLFLLITFCGSLFAQQKVTGTIMDTNGNPVEVPVSSLEDPNPERPLPAMENFHLIFP